MAADNLQTDEGPAIPKLALELEQLHLGVQRMERLLDGAESILATLRYDGPEKLRGMRMIEFLGEELERWREEEEGRDCPSDDIWELWERAKDGRLIRYGESILEPAE